MRWRHELHKILDACVRDMRTYHAISFRSALELEELASVLGLDPVEFDAENEDEWALGTLGGFDDIDVARTHLLPPGETRTKIFRYNAGPDRTVPVWLVRKIHAALRSVASEFEVHGVEDGEWFKLVGAEVDAL